jgi:hypothetical protein
MTQCGDVVGIPVHQKGFDDLGGVRNCLGRDEIADVMSVDPFGGRHRDENELGQLVYGAAGGDDAFTELGPKYRKCNIRDLHGFDSLTR